MIGWRDFLPIGIGKKCHSFSCEKPVVRAFQLPQGLVGQFLWIFQAYAGAVSQKIRCFDIPPGTRQPIPPGSLTPSIGQEVATANHAVDAIADEHGVNQLKVVVVEGVKCPLGTRARGG